MSSVDSDAEVRLDAGIPTRIAQLGADIPDQSSRTVRGEVTVIWPYSAVKQTLAFLLAEPDVRLRRAKGQVRVELRGASAKAVAELGIGSGDELTLLLDGVEWAQDASAALSPATRLEWQLIFTNKLLLRAKLGESLDARLVHVNSTPPTAHAPEPRVEPALDIPETPARPSVLAQTIAAPATAPNLSQPEEWASPAFIKRARLSYGSLFEGGFDLFEDDGGVPGKGRKRTKFGRESNGWRYSSQSASPEPERTPDRAQEGAAVDEAIRSSPPRPQMLDEGVQTVAFETSGPEPDAQQPWGVSAARTPSTLSGEPVLARSSESPTIRRMRPGEQAPPATEFATTSHSSGFTMFGSLAPQHATSAPWSQPEASSSATNGLGMAEQVKFSFDSRHFPVPPSVSEPMTLSSGNFSAEDVAGDSDPGVSGPSETRDGVVAVAELEMPLDPRLADVPDADDILESHRLVPDSTPVQWPVSSQQAAGSVADAEEEDVESPRESDHEESQHSSPMRAPDVPVGFDSYGKEGLEIDDGGSEDGEGEDDKENDVDAEDGRDFIENDEVVDDLDDEVAVDHDDEEAEYLDEDGGDYDQRVYADKQDDEEGYSEDDDEVADGGEDGGRTNGMFRGDVDAEMFYDEEDESEEDVSDEDEDDEEDEEEMEDSSAMAFSRPRLQPAAYGSRAAQPVQRGQPEVIDLISDSEDDEAPPPKQSQGNETKEPIMPDVITAKMAAEPPEDAMEQDNAADDAEMESDEGPLEDAEGESELLQDEVAPTSYLGEAVQESGKAAQPDVGVQEETAPQADLQAEEPGLVKEPDQPNKGVATTIDPDAMDIDAAEDEGLNTVTVAEPKEAGSQQPGSDEPENLQAPAEEQASSADGNVILDRTEEQRAIPVDGDGNQAAASTALDVGSRVVPLDEHQVTEAEIAVSRPEPPVLHTETSLQSAPVASQATTAVDEHRPPTAVFESQTVLRSFEEPVIIEEKITMEASVEEIIVTEDGIAEEIAGEDAEKSGEGDGLNATAIADVSASSVAPVKDDGRQDDKAAAQEAAEPSQLSPTSDTQPTTAPQAQQAEHITAVESPQNKVRERPTPPKSPPTAKSVSVDPSIQFARAAVAARRGKTDTPQPRVSPRHTRTRSASSHKGEPPDVHDASVQLARATVRGPEKVTEADLTKRLQTELPDIVPLKALRPHVGRHLDVVGVATTQPPEPQRAKGGPRQYVLAFNMTDPSIAAGGASSSNNAVVEVQVFRAHKETLPAVRAGDGVLLRDFQVVALPKRGFGLRSTDGSAWAVFDSSGGKGDDKGSYQVRGPPIEVDAAESAGVAALRAWFGALDKATRAKLDRANQKFAEAVQQGH